jgi:hypothetical protein
MAFARCGVFRKSLFVLSFVPCRDVEGIQIIMGLFILFFVLILFLSIILCLFLFISMIADASSL